MSSMLRPIDKHIQEAQKQRNVIKERSSKYSASVVTLQVLGAGTKGCPKSLFIFTDQNRYLFNCGEGTQRLAHEHKMKLARLEHIFFTSASWSNMGGMPGIALTLQDTGVPKIILHGPSNLDELFKATRRFVILKDMKIEMADCTSGNIYEDSVMTMKYILLQKSSNSSSDNDPVSNKFYQSLEPDNTDYYAHESSGRRNVHDFDIVSLLEGQRNEQLCVMAYICRLKPTLGTLDLQKCVEKGVKPGPNLGLLKNGQDVTLPNGNIVYAKDVRTPDDPGPVFIVIEVPHIDFLDSLLKQKEFSIHQNITNLDDCPAVIVHFTPEEIIRTEKYQAFMRSFPSETKHLILNENNTCPGSVAISRIQTKLNILDDNIFPMLKTEIPQEKDIPKDFQDSVIEEMGKINNQELMKHLKAKLANNDETHHKLSNDESNLILAKTLTSFHLRPKKGLDRSLEIRQNNLQYVGETILHPGFSECIEKIHSMKSQLKTSPVEKYPKVVFFGTGSCIPNKTRNTSCIMVQINARSNMILDCGEGSFGQIVRFYGKENLVNVLKNLKAIYVSHLHADHHLGLIGILQGRRQILKSHSIDELKPINLFAPKQIITWLCLYHRRFETLLHEFKLIPNSSLCKNHEDYSKLSDSELNFIGLKDLETCLVQHCPNSFGVSLLTNHLKKITYSGDTMPCMELVRIGKNSDLLIHEATMEDALAGEAKYKMHSTVSQAVDIGKKMEAKFTLLTHFSQRYARVPLLSPEIENSKKQDIGVAFDNMEVTLNDLPLLPHFYPALKLMFAEHFEDLEVRAMKRAIKRERQQSPITLNVQHSRSISSHQVTKKYTPDRSPN